MDLRFEVTLAGNGAPTAAQDVRWVDAQTLSLVIPATLAVGTYAVVVRAPDGAVATLAAGLIDRGVDVGVDVNGAAPGLFVGPAPDLGAWEAP